MRLVLDTNVVLSALLWRGTPYRLLETVRQHESAQLFSSVPLLEELADVLTRPSTAKRLAVIGWSAREALRHYVEAVDLVSPAAIAPVVAGDPDDDVVIATAIAAQAHLIVSGDKALLAVGAHQGVAIVNAAEAVKAILGAQAGA